MLGIKRKEPQSQSGGQSAPKKFKQENGDKYSKKPYSGDKKFSKHDGDKKYQKDDGGKKVKAEDGIANGDVKKPVVKELYDSQSSKEAHAKQRAVARDRKAAKPNADSIARAKKLWERLRRKSHVPKEERQELVTELFDIVTGNVKDFVFKHDSVRVVQCAVKYANVEQKKSIARELQGTYRELAESRYAKFLVAKLMVEDKETREMIISEFYGSVKRLINHPEASWILDDTYRGVASPTQKAILLREWYGAEFAIANKALAGKPAASLTADTTITSDLSAILEATPEKRKPMTEHLFALINALVQKKLTGFTMLHDAMLQYSLSILPGDASSTTALLDLLKPTEEADTDLLKNLAFTPSGARLVRRTLAAATAKDRKLLLKPYKDHVEALAFDAYGHTVLLAACEVVDDTVLVSKFIFPALLGAQFPDAVERTAHILSITAHPTARIVLLSPFVPTSSESSTSSDTATTSSATISIPKPSRWLYPPGTDTSTALLELLTLRSTLSTSKKSPSLRSSELAKHLLTASDGALLAAIASDAATLCGSSFGCQMVQEVLLSAPAAVGADDAKLAAAMEAVAALAGGDPDSEGHVASNSAAGRMLKTLVLGRRYDPNPVDGGVALDQAEQRLKFADVLFPQVKEYLGKWAMGASSFVVVNLLEEGSGLEGRERKEAVKILEGQRKSLEEAKKGGNKGAGMVLERLAK